jgi:hypothetical protein
MTSRKPIAPTNVRTSVSMTVSRTSPSASSKMTALPVGDASARKSSATSRASAVTTALSALASTV